MAIEIECKYRIPDLDGFIGRLEERGISLGPPIEQIDLYLAHPSRDFRQSGEALRIRRDGDDQCITYKGPKRAGPTKTREEREVPFASGPEAFNDLLVLFQALGFQPVAEVRKHRRSACVSHAPTHSTERDSSTKISEATITQDQVAMLGDFAEIEVVARDEADVPHAQRVVLELAESFGLDQLETRSYLRMVLENSQET